MKNLTQKLSGFFLGILNFFAWLFQWIILFKPYWKKFVRFIVRWNEIITIPTGFALFYFTPMLLRMADPTSAGYDLGILHAIIFAIAAMCIISGFTFLLIKINFPAVFKFIDEVFEEHFYQNSSINSTNLTTYQKCVLSLSLFAVYLLGTVLLVRVF